MNNIELRKNLLKAISDSGGGYEASMKCEEICLQYAAQCQLEKQSLSDEEIDKLAEKEYPLIMPTEFHPLIKSYRKTFIKGFKAALQNSHPINK